MSQSIKGKDWPKNLLLKKGYKYTPTNIKCSNSQPLDWDKKVPIILLKRTNSRVLIYMHTPFYLETKKQEGGKKRPFFFPAKEHYLYWRNGTKNCSTIRKQLSSSACLLWQNPKKQINDRNYQIHWHRMPLVFLTCGMFACAINSHHA